MHFLCKLAGHQCIMDTEFDKTLSCDISGTPMQLATTECIKFLSLPRRELQGPLHIGGAFVVSNAFLTRKLSPRGEKLSSRTVNDYLCFLPFPLEKRACITSATSLRYTDILIYPENVTVHVSAYISEPFRNRLRCMQAGARASISPAARRLPSRRARKK